MKRRWEKCRSGESAGEKCLEEAMHDRALPAVMPRRNLLEMEIEEARVGGGMWPNAAGAAACL